MLETCISYFIFIWKVLSDASKIIFVKKFILGSYTFLKLLILFVLTISNISQVSVLKYSWFKKKHFNLHIRWMQFVYLSTCVFVLDTKSPLLWPYHTTRVKKQQLHETSGVTHTFSFITMPTMDTFSLPCMFFS